MYAVAKLMLSLKVKPDAEEMCDEKQTATVKVSNWERSDLHCGSCHRQKNVVTDGCNGTKDKLDSYLG